MTLQLPRANKPLVGWRETSPWGTLSLARRRDRGSWMTDRRTRTILAAGLKELVWGSSPSRDGGSTDRGATYTADFGPRWARRAWPNAQVAKRHSGHRSKATRSHNAKSTAVLGTATRGHPLRTVDTAFLQSGTPPRYGAWRASSPDSHRGNCRRPASPCFPLRQRTLPRHCRRRRPLSPRRGHAECGVGHESAVNAERTRRHGGCCGTNGGWRCPPAHSDRKVATTIRARRPVGGGGGSDRTAGTCRLRPVGGWREHAWARTTGTRAEILRA